MSQVSVADIILAVDEPIDATQCGGKENCQDDHKCITHDLWDALGAHIVGFLAVVTLKQVVDGGSAIPAMSHHLPALFSGGQVPR